MKRSAKLAVLGLFVLLLTAGISLINLTTQVTGILPIANGGTGQSASGTSGQVLESQGAGQPAVFADPIVSGPDAPGAAPTKNPVQMGIFDGTNVQRALGSSAGRLSIDVNTMPTVAVTGTFWQATQPVSGTVDRTAITPVLENGLSTTVQTVVGSAAKLDSYYCFNPNSSVAYVQIFDISGTVTLGTSTPKWSIGIPATGGANLSNLNLSFANAIKVAATTTATGSSAPTTAIDCNFGYR